MKDVALWIATYIEILWKPMMREKKRVKIITRNIIYVISIFLKIYIPATNI